MNLSVAFLLLLVATNAPLVSASSGELVASTPGDVDVDDTTMAVYDCKLTSKWSGVRHPVDYPVEAHYSFPVLVSHNTNYSIWKEGTTATPGVKLVAEAGPTTTIEVELTAAGDDVYNKQIGNVQWNTDTGSVPAEHIIGLEQTIAGLKVAPTHKYISTITMLAPSPDWFTGFSNFEPIKDDKWYASFTIATQPFDAGTDDGVTFKSANAVTTPQGTISELTFATQEASGIFVDAMVNGTEVLPTALWECTLMSTMLVDGSEAPTSAPSAGNVALSSLSFMAAALASLFL